jgi:hypothetical protein
MIQLPTDGLVYALYIPSHDAVKVGYSTNVPSRIESHMRLWPDIRLIGLHEGGMRFEKRVLDLLSVKSSYVEAAPSKEVFQASPRLLRALSRVFTFVTIRVRKYTLPHFDYYAPLSWSEVPVQMALTRVFAS